MKTYLLAYLLTYLIISVTTLYYFRMKMPCISSTEENLVTVHHEMGHIQYYLAYVPQPFVYRAAANNGFQESIGDAIALSITTPKYLHDLGLIDQIHSDKGNLHCSL